MISPGLLQVVVVDGRGVTALQVCATLLLSCWYRCTRLQCVTGLLHGPHRARSSSVTPQRAAGLEAGVAGEGGVPDAARPLPRAHGGCVGECPGVSTAQSQRLPMEPTACLPSAALPSVLPNCTAA